MQALFTNELEDICTALDPGAACTGIIQNWQRVLFSDAPDHSLRRYFTFQLEGISKIRDTLPAVGHNGTVVLKELTDHLLSYYLKYIDRDMPAPDSYRKSVLQELSGDIAGVKNKMAGCGPVVAYIGGVEELDTHTLFSFRALDYFRLLVTELAVLNEKRAGDLLVSLNFNHLGYLSWLQDHIGERIAALGSDGLRKSWLIAEQARVHALPERLGAVYHPDWPSLKTMLADWLAGLIRLLPETAEIVKLPLNMSVAHLACLIRLFYEEDWYKETNLTAIFNFYASVFSTKKQAAISPGSLSKEYYGIDQVTAAIILDKLQKMAARINRNFFPG